MHVFGVNVKLRSKGWPKPTLYRRTPFKIVTITKSRGCAKVMTVEEWIESTRRSEGRRELKLGHQPIL
jgi:hypothetical protein